MQIKKKRNGKYFEVRGGNKRMLNEHCSWTNPACVSRYKYMDEMEELKK